MRTGDARGVRAQPLCLCVRGLGGAQGPTVAELYLPRASRVRGPVSPELQRVCFGVGRVLRAVVLRGGVCGSVVVGRLQGTGLTCLHMARAVRPKSKQGGTALNDSRGDRVLRPTR